MFVSPIKLNSKNSAVLDGALCAVYFLSKQRLTQRENLQKKLQSLKEFNTLSFVNVEVFVDVHDGFSSAPWSK